MKITFKSIAKNNDKENKIEFDAPVKISNENNMRVFEFEEPSHKVMNRIEFSEKKVNIFAGPSTINLELNKKIFNSYQTPNGLISFESFLQNIEIKQNNVNIKYYLSQNDKKFGDFDIKLIIK